MRLFRRTKSNVWQAAFKGRDGRWIHRSTNRSDKAAAREVALGYERDALRDPRDEAAEAATVADALKLLSEHVAHQVDVGELAGATGDFYTVKAGHVLRVLGGDFPLRRIDASRVRSYCTARQKEGAGTHTIVKELTALRVALRLAVEQGLWRGALDTLVPPGIRANYVPRTRWLPRAEVDALMAALPPGRAALVAYAVATGAEASALARAERTDVKLPKRGTAARGNVLVRGSKNANRLRTVPVVLAEAAELLRYALKHGDGDGPLLFNNWHNINRDLVDACKAAKIARCSPNDLRRTYAHWHYQAGVTLDVLAPAMGHATTTMLSRIYAKPSAEELDKKMRRQVGPSKPPPKKPSRRAPHPKRKKGTRR